MSQRKLSMLSACVASTLSFAFATGAFGQAPAPGGQTVQALPGPAVPERPQKEVPNFVPVTDAMLRAPKPEDWLLFRGNQQGWGYSPLEQINKQNVKSLQLVWARAMEPGTNEITPIVHDGIMYLGNPSDVIQAIDAATGELIWDYHHPLPPRASFPSIWGQRKRSITLYGNYVTFATWNNFVVALDARTGKLVWQNDRRGDLLESNSSGPIVANGMVIVGSTCQVAGHGCYVTGHDVRNGEELWRNELIPHPGQPGDETWARRHRCAAQSDARSGLRQRRQRHVRVRSAIDTARLPKGDLDSGRRLLAGNARMELKLE